MINTNNNDNNNNNNNNNNEMIIMPVITSFVKFSHWGEVISSLNIRRQLPELT